MPGWTGGAAGGPPPRPPRRRRSRQRDAEPAERGAEPVGIGEAQAQRGNTVLGRGLDVLWGMSSINTVALRLS